jgi:structural maintenance of chromosome 1
LIRNRLLYKLFHNEESLEANTRAIHAQNKALISLRAEQRVHDQALDSARAEQAGVTKTEEGIEGGEGAGIESAHTHTLIQFEISFRRST